MTICYFGDFDPAYVRNKVITRGLQENGVQVLFCNNRSRGIKKYFKLWKLHNQIKNKYDLLIVGYSDTRWITVLAKLISRKDIVWDGFYSIYDSWVFDRKLVSPRSIKAGYYWFMDWLNCRLAYKILTDTDEHIKYFVNTFGVKPSKFLRVWVGADEEIFYSRQDNVEAGLVLFFGHYIPLQGVEYIVEAAKILQNQLVQVKFEIIGRGQEYKKIRALADQLEVKIINFIDELPIENLADRMAKAVICLGIFGNTDKTLRVIPTKIYSAIAMAKPVISADTPAMRELFTDQVNILFCHRADPQDLAAKIQLLLDNQAIRTYIAQSAHLMYNKHLNNKAIGSYLKNHINQWLNA